jgi:hypothetical protein
VPELLRPGQLRQIEATRGNPRFIAHISEYTGDKGRDKEEQG